MSRGMDAASTVAGRADVVWRADEGFPVVRPSRARWSRRRDRPVGCGTHCPIGQRSWPLRGFVVVGIHDHGFDHLRQHVWQLGTPPEPRWANLVDSSGDRVAAGPHDIAQALEAAFR